MAVDGQSHKLINVGTNQIVIKHDNAASAVNNRFYNVTGADIVLGSSLTSKLGVEITYNDALKKWLVYSKQ